MILIGTKAERESERRVSLEQAKADYQHLGIECFEAYCETGEGVEEGFRYLIESCCPIM
mgnify:CR=1 FL=1